MLDPMSMMMLASGLQQPGQEALPGLSPMAGAPQQGAAVAPNAAPQSPLGGLGSLGSALQGIKSPEPVKPQFSGGVSGSGLPYVAGIENSMPQFLQSIGGGRPGGMPTLGALLSQAPGGGR